jgi:hypothetical protein
LKRSTFKIATGCLLFFLLLFAPRSRADAQTRPGDAHAQDVLRTTTQTRSEPSSSADEEFELNIVLRRINESDYHAETSVSTGGARGLQLNVGVALRAGDIDVLLRNVHGHVRFRASLDPVLRLLDAHRSDAPQSQPARSPP